MVRGFPKARSTRGYDPQSMQNTIAIIILERERNVPPRGERKRRFWLARGHGEDGGAPSSLEVCVCVLACQYLALCVSMVKREKPKLSMKA